MGKLIFTENGGTKIRNFSRIHVQDAKGHVRVISVERARGKTLMLATGENHEDAPDLHVIAEEAGGRLFDDRPGRAYVFGLLTGAGGLFLAAFLSAFVL